MRSQMALLANQMMDARILTSMNGKAELSQFLRITNQSMVSQVNSAQEDNRKNRKYPCPLCGKRFRFNSILSLHMRTHTGEKPFKCPYCDHRAAQKGNLKIHLRTHKQGILGKGRGRIREENRLLHELEERAILRDRQTRTGFASQHQLFSINQLRQPQLSQTVQPQPSVLTSSGAESQPQASPQVTAFTEDPIQPQSTGFRCSFCKGKFRKQQELERHIRILHKPYKCTLCEFAASQEEELIGHVEMVHITADSGSGQKPAMGSGDKRKAAGEFPCEVCGQTFSQAWFLKGHMRKHKDSFEHSCQICGRRFKEPWFLKNHMKVHLNKLAAKHNLPAEHDASDSMANLTQDRQSSFYSQYISRIHSRFFTAERADHHDYNQVLATAGVDMKVQEMLGRMISSGPGPLTDAVSSSLLGLNHLHPPLSSTAMEYLQKVISSRDSLNSSSYPGWQIMPSGPPIETQMFPPKDQQQCSSYLPDRRVPVDDGKACLSDPDTKAISTPSSPGCVSHHGPTEISADNGSPHSGMAFDPRRQSSSPATGEKVYRCPLSSDYTAAQRASLSFHLDHYQFPHWQNSRDLSSPVQPTTSSSPSPIPKLRPRSRDGWSPAAGHYLGLESHGESALLISKQSELTDKDGSMDGSLSTRTRKSQYEPLDLSVRPESVMSPAALVQMSGIFSNGVSSTITRRLQIYPSAGAELSVNPTFQCDLLVQGTKEEGNTQNGASTGNDGKIELEKPEQESDDENNATAKWKILKHDAAQTEELAQASADFQGTGENRQDKLGPWGRAVAESSMPSLENFTPGQAVQHRDQGGLLSFLRSQGNLGGNSASMLKASLNGQADMEKDVTSGQKPFQCRYCPYSASQKGNLKTHVLCVHRKPFDNSLYPDRRLRRSHAPQRPSRLPQSITADNRASGKDQIGMTSLCGT